MLTDYQKYLDSSGVYKEFFEISYDLMCVAGTDGFFKIVNPAFTELLGYAKDELLEKPFLSFVHPDDQISTDDTVVSIRESGHSVRNFENRYITKSDGVVYLQWMSTPPNEEGLFFAIARDVTDQKKASQELMRNEELFNASQSLAKLGNFSFNAAEQTLYWSPELYNIFGITEEEKENLFEAYINRFDPEGFNLYESKVNECFAKGTRYAFEHKVHIPDGPVKQVSCIGVPFKNEKGEVYRIDGVVQDVTQIKEHENVLEKSIHEKEVLIKELHHRVKNNLQVISSLLRLQAELVEDEEVKSHLLESRNRIHSMASVHNLLYRSQNLGAIDFGYYLRKLTDDLSMSYFGEPKMITVNFDLNETELDIDKAIPLGILMNELISNAFKHAFSDLNKANLAIVISSKNERLEVSVRDNGKGFNPNKIDKRNSLGLNLIDSLSDQLSANIAFDSSGNGTVVTLDLPLH
ncbi:MAG: histidine kinase dimerization/phosphoacceptor domain -containing protein [Crocinitomicaceae bacterium]